MSKRLSVFSPAKLNLYLNVLDKGVDGYHGIETVFQGIDLFDHLIFELTEAEADFKPEIMINLSSGRQKHLVPTDKRNLVYQAAKLYFRKIEADNLNLTVTLNKNIPVSGGLAGGSSNAAATLYALNYILGEPLKQHEVLELCRELGSDVPFCYLGGCMLGTGRGDQLTRLSLPLEFIFVIVFPPADLELKAKDVYETFDKLNQNKKTEVSIEKFIETMLTKSTGISKYLYNSLEEAVISLSFWVDKAKSAIDSKGYTSLVSGSGPTVFTLAPNEAQAKQLRLKLVDEGFEVAIHRAIDNSFQVIAH
jgi:4-diphosphocytidyl-2-C-methyl-D-erythritol kinase